MPSLAVFCERMRYWCDEGNLGYDQIERWNIYEGGECDCSSLVIHCLQEAGFDTGDAYYTGNLSENLTARGWERLWPDISSAQPGDILLNDANHVAAVVDGYGWGATIGEAWLDENGGIYYGQSGDQNGLETRTRGIYNFPWDCFLRYTGESEDDMTTPDEVWQYYWINEKGSNTAPGGNMYNCLVDVHRLLGSHKSAAGDGTVGDMSERLDYVDMRVRKMAGDVDGIKKAVEKMQVGGGSVDYDKLANAVADKLAARMKD